MSDLYLSGESTIMCLSLLDISRCKESTASFELSPHRAKLFLSDFGRLVTWKEEYGKAGIAEKKKKDARVMVSSIRVEWWHSS